MRKNRVMLLLGMLCCLSTVTGLFAATPINEPSVKAVRLAVEDLARSFPDRYTRAEEFLAQLDRIEKMSGEEKTKALATLQREALLANPLLENERIMLVCRKILAPDPTSNNKKKNDYSLGLTFNFEGSSRLGEEPFDNSVRILRLDDLQAEMEPLFVPKGDKFVGDLDLHFDGTRVLFTMPNDQRNMRVYEMELPVGNEKKPPRELPLIPDSDVSNYDACYLPDGNIIFASSATYQGVPCVQGLSFVANLYLFDRKSGNIRRLTFDQDHNWNPTVLNDGRIMYLRWEYADIPHFASRIVFHMNPDGTNQAEYYGSGSYWPNAVFYPRAIPGEPSMFVGIVSGHHGTARAGELVLFDPAKGRFEADGVVQRIPGYGKKVEPVIEDYLVDKSLPLFLHPYPLSAKYFIVAAKTSTKGRWGIYLVDIFDNMVLLRMESGHHLFEPVLLKKRAVPPVIPSRVDTSRTDATIQLVNVYEGVGLKGVPKGAVKKLRLVTYHFAYRNMGGQQDPIGLDGPWDPKCVLGTVPVEADGSAFFRVPANVPIAFQPLDAEGKALQLMRSWSTAMPGENAACIGCHEPQSSAPPITSAPLAFRRKPSEITPWSDELRGFSFRREVEPIVDRRCASCHGLKDPAQAAASEAPQYDSPYLFLRHLVRTSSAEADMHFLKPLEFHADTTELVRMLKTGHKDVRLEPEEWQKIITWIDLNTPYHGTWTENVGRERMEDSVQRRRDLMQRYAGIDGVSENPEELELEPEPEKVKAWRIPPKTTSPGEVNTNVSVRVSRETGEDTLSLKISENETLDFVRIPAGSYTVGEKTVTIDRPYWMATREISNRQYNLFDSVHDSRLEPGDWLYFDSVKRGSALNEPEQPVVKVSWNEAVEFCKWLSARSGKTIELPTEEEWEWACRAGSEDPFWYGKIGAPFAQFENLADKTFYKRPGKWADRQQWRPAVIDQDDGHKVSAAVGTFSPNPWGLFDMHGNVAEWTTSIFEAGDAVSQKRVIRGGSWSTRPKWAWAGARWGYREYQKVYDVGFRVIWRE